MRDLLTWYNKHGRNLPWRRTRDAYRIFISELMLQQTQVERVLPKYRTWLKRFPDWTSLAAATTRGLVEAWAGLGYNRRALYAREAARHVVTHGVPQDEVGWRRLRGVGPYMAAALAEFINHARALVIDTNIRRVVGRALLGKPFPQTTDDARILKQLDKLTPRRGKHWELPQALMDLGTIVCVSRIPHCDACPLQKICKARTRFLPDQLDRTLRLKHRRKTVERRHADKKYPDRIYRGRILTAVTHAGRLQVTRLGPLVDPTYTASSDAAWIKRLVKRLEKDGLLTLYGRIGIVTLPKT